MAWQDEADQLAQDVEDTFGVSVAYLRIVKGALNTTTGARAETISSTTITAVRGRARVEPIGNEGGSREETVVYTIKADAIAFRPNVGDTITDGTINRDVSSVESSVDEECWEVTTKRKV